MQLYEMTAGNDWPLIVVPEVVGRTVERTRGIVQVRYLQKKPQVSVEVDDDISDDPGPTKKLDLDLFFRDIPKDLVQPYRDAIREWEKGGGTIYFSNKMLFFEMELAGQNQRVVRCRNTKWT